MATCQDNSTDCLLRAILEANSGFDWNALNFACTAAIGILALVIATTTVFQGFLTKTRFSWSELRVRTTAHTPFISSTSIDVALRDALAHRISQNGNNQASETITDEDQYHALKKFPATWLNLLDFVNLYSPNIPTLPCETDYLPTDLQAAPARISVEALVLLSATAGCDRLELVVGNPQLSGPSLQVDIRQHPQLGPVASYEQFPHDRTYRLSDLAKDIQIGTCAKGILDYKGAPSVGLRPEVSWTGDTGEILRDLESKGGDCGHQRCSKRLIPSQDPLAELAICLLAADSTATARAFPTAKLRVWECVHTLAGFCETWHAGSASTAGSLLKLLDSRHGNLRHLDSTMFRGQPLIGELREKRLERLYIERPNLFTINRAIALNWSWLPPDAIARVRYRRPAWYLPGAEPLQETDLVVVADALSLCKAWLEDTAAVALLTEQEIKASKQCAVSAQLEEVDYWLLKNGNAEAACAARALYLELVDRQTTGASLLTQWQSPPDNTASGSGSAVQPGSDDPMRTILVYRAVLYAILLAMSLDNSDVLDTNLGRRVVYFI